MLVASRPKHVLPTAAFVTRLQKLSIAAFLLLSLGTAASADDASIEQKVQALAPSLEKYVETYMKGFDVPGVRGRHRRQ